MLLAVGLWTTPAWPQAAAIGAATGALAPTATAQPTPQPSAATLKQLLDTVEDPAKREHLVEQIKALIAIEENRAAAPAPPGAGARLLDALSSTFAALADGVDYIVLRAGDPAPLWAWAEAQITDPTQRALWLIAGFNAAIVLAGGFVAWFAVGFALAPARRRIERQAASRWQRRLRLIAARLGLELVPIVAFAAVALVLVGWARAPEPLRLVLLAITNATALSLLGNTLSRMLLSPAVPVLRALPLADDTAASVYVWARRLIVAVVWSYVLLQTAILLRMSYAAYLAAAELAGLLVAGLLAVFVYRHRDPVAASIRGPLTGALAETGATEPPGLRARLSRIWHIVAIGYIVMVYLVWALGVSAGPGYLLLATAGTGAVAAALMLAETRLRRFLESAPVGESAILARYPRVASRAGRYLPIVRVSLIYALRVAAVIAVLAAWRVNVASPLTNPVGAVILGHLSGIVMILLVALVTWELAAGAISNYLQRADSTGQAIVRSVRARTLLPLIRNVLLIAITVLTVLATLSELGVNIGPLLAGAGVVGLAIGIGAQSLVRDVITGAFILFEDTINIGDVVEINGKGGVVEGLTVRTIRLRDGSGNVHTLTFGSVTAITNMTKEYAYYLFDIPVTYRTNTDEVIEILREIDQELREDPAFVDSILEPIDIMGVERFTDLGVVLRARTKTRPIKQWGVGREFNRRLKQKFDERGIEFPSAHTAIYVNADRQDGASPARPARRPDGDAPEGVATAPKASD